MSGNAKVIITLVIDGSARDALETVDRLLVTNALHDLIEVPGTRFRIVEADATMEEL